MGLQGGGEFKPRASYQVVGGHCGEEVSSNPREASESGLRLARGRRHPPEVLFHAFPADLTDGVARVSFGPAINGTPAPSSVSGDVESDVPLPQLLDEVSTVVALVGSERDSAFAADGLDRAESG